MCSDSLKRMESCYGDLADVVRASSSCGTRGDMMVAASPLAESRSPRNPVINSFHLPEDFGNPFTHLRDPLLNDIATQESGFRFMNAGLEEGTGGGKANGCINLAHKILDHEDMTNNSENFFSRMLHNSPNSKFPVSPRDSTVAASPRGLKCPRMLVPESCNGCLVESPILQISTPQNMGIKKRKNQTKKVICIPAPAPANSRLTGEIVPSDLWAWRKYGQKPIKGSPYPRGYYRCSSSKGCSARKQVERSRTDPNMLVITYTSEHNHPWPTQRNALAGSTRSHHQTTKNTTATGKTGKCPPDSHQAQKERTPKEEEEEKETSIRSGAVSVETGGVKQEMDQDNQFDMDGEEFDQKFPTSYRPGLVESSDHLEDNFFADLGEIETDPLGFLFRRGLSGVDKRENTEMDPFSLCLWAVNSQSTATSTTSATTSYGEVKRDSCF